MRWNDDFINLLIKLIEEGGTVEYISNIMGTSEQVISSRVYKMAREDNNMRYLKEKFNENNDINRKKRRNKMKQWTKEEDDLLIELRKNNTSYEIISKKYIITDVNQLSFRARELGINKQKTPWKEEEDDLAIEMYLDGESLESIDLKLDRGKGAIEQRLKRLSIFKPKRWKESDDKALLFLYSTEKTYKEIAEILNKDENFIKNKLKKIGIIIDNNGICKRCNDKPATGKGEYEGLCKECIKDKKDKEKLLKKTEEDNRKNKDIINAYIERNKDNLKFCEKCNSEKDRYKDYYYYVKYEKDESYHVIKSCKICELKKTKNKKIKNLKNRGYK